MKNVLLTLMMLTLPVNAAQAGGSGPMPMSPMAMQNDMHVRMEPVMQELRGLSGAAFDRAFYSTMIPHHAAAVEMSRVVLPRLRDPLVRAWAQSIIDEQQREIDQMKAALKRLGGPDTARMNMMQQAMQGMNGPMKTAPMPDQMFLEMMTPHHAGANDMSTLALQRSNDAGVLSLSQQIIFGQTVELHNFKDWLRTHR